MKMFRTQVKKWLNNTKIIKSFIILSDSDRIEIDYLPEGIKELKINWHPISPKPFYSPYKHKYILQMQY